MKVQCWTAVYIERTFSCCHQDSTHCLIHNTSQYTTTTTTNYILQKGHPPDTSHVNKKWKSSDKSHISILDSLISIYPPLQAPVDRRIIHFIHQNNQVFYTSCFGQHGMFPCLSAFLKTSLKLTFPGRDHLGVNTCLR